MEIRKIKDSDLKQVRKLHVYSTGRQWTDSEPSKETLAFYTLDEIIGMFNGEELMSMIRNYTFNQSVRGTVKRMGGVSHVATFPEYRLKGYAKQLMKAAFLDMKEKHHPVSTLHPFKESYYEAFGYVGTNDNVLLNMSMDGLYPYLKNQHEIQGKWEEKRVRAVDVQQEFEDFKLQLNLKKHHGLVFLNDMSSEYWKDDHEDVLVVFIKKDDEIVAGAKYIKIGNGEGGRLFVIEMYWKTLEARLMLFRFFAKHIDQFSHIELRFPFGTNFFPLVKDCSRPFEVSVNNRPWMVRIIEAMEAVKDIEVESEGRAVLSLKDDFCTWNNGTYILEAVDNRLVMRRTEIEKPQINMDIKGLTALLYGVYSVEELEFKQWIASDNEAVNSILNRWFSKEIFYNPYYY